MGREEDEAWRRAGALAALRTPGKVVRWLEGALPCPAPPAGWREALEARGLAPWVPPAGPAAVALVRGTPPERGVAVVGSRASDAYGLSVARRVAQDVVALGRWVISGGAEGCDAAAHRGALEAGGRTAVVLGSGHDHPYPARHRGLFEEIVARGGCTVSAWWPTARPAKHQFLFRNRIVAAVSEAVVVARAAARSGALSTARAALALGRPTLVVPGDVGAAQSQGGHAMIAKGAGVLTGPRVLAEAIGAEGGVGRWPVGFEGAAAPWSEVAAQPVFSGASGPGSEAVLRALAQDSALDLDGLAVRTGEPTDVLAASLLDLELSGLIQRLPGDRFVLMRRVTGG